MRFVLLTLSVVILLNPLAAQAKMYKWVDDEGQMHFGDRIPTKYQVKGVPTMLLFKDGKQVWRQSGVLQKKDIVQIIQSKN